MNTITVRKAVYVPIELWKRLDGDAKKSYDAVTTVLKNILLEHYNLSSGNNNNPDIGHNPSATTRGRGREGDNF